MSLDVTLIGGTTQIKCVCTNCGHHHMKGEEAEHFSANITHNLNKMAETAGIYQALWRPEEIGVTKAKQLLVPLTAGLAGLKLNPRTFKDLEPLNGWGSYSTLVDFVERYLAACVAHPEARVKVSR